MNQTSTLKKANIDNLTGLWQTASRPFDGFCETDSYTYYFVPGSGWPNKLWFKDAPTQESLSRVKEGIMPKVPSLHISSWDDAQNQTALFEKSGFHVASEQVAMYKYLATPLPFKSDLDIKRIRKAEDIAKWSGIYPEAFGYAIHKDILLATSENIHFYLASYNNRPVGTAMLFYTDHIAGIHGVGIIPEVRRKGFADQIMAYVLNEAIKHKAETVVLQASSMGQTLYTRLGFEEQFIMKNYTIH